MNNSSSPFLFANSLTVSEFMIEKIQTGLLSFDNVNLIEAGAEVAHLGSADKFSYVVTPNIDHLSRLSGAVGSDLHTIYLQASLSLCDSRIVEKILRLSKKDIKAVVPGSDLTIHLFEQVLLPEHNVLVLGCSESEITALKSLYPKLNIQHINPSMGFINKPEEVNQLVQRVIESNADYLFLAVGSPRQEIFANKLKQAGLQKGVALCIGASINFILGAEVRAPKWIQKIHMEWCYRMLQDPKRLVKRYALNAIALPQIIRLLSKNNL